MHARGHHRAIGSYTDENMRLIKTLMDGELPGGKYYFVPDWQKGKQGLFVVKAKIDDLIYSEKIVRIP